MGTAMRTSLDVEFGTYTEWLVDAIVEVAPQQLIPPTCRGTGQPQLLERLADGLRLTSSSLVLDLGSGLGGPAAWLAAHHGCRVIGTDVMETEVRAAARLFPGSTAAVGAAEELPWRDACFDAVWCLGVLEMIEDKRRVAREIARVLRPGARFAIYGFFATGRPFTHEPSANHFASLDECLADLAASGLALVDAVPYEGSSSPDEWRQAVMAIRDEVHRRHSGDERFALALAQLGSFNWLRTSGCISDWLVIGERL
jgi:ubiquinone/menaquinone biosynthesis C-methylase UbiE